MKMFIDRATNYFSASYLFAESPIVHFRPETETCPCCEEHLKVRKSREKTVFTLHLGKFTANETITECRNEDCSNQQKYGSEDLSKRVMPFCNYGYDVMVYAGKAMFLRHRQGNEIQAELSEKNVTISLSEVYYLAEKFIVYLAALHKMRNDRICDIISENGGYILHLDTFGDKDSPRIITGIDSISDFVLGNMKIASEKSSYIEPFLNKIAERFGQPVGVVQDMGRGIMNAVQKVFVGVRIYICHFHFLRDIGKDLLGENYDLIRKRLRHYGILTELRKAAGSLEELIDDNFEFIGEFSKSVIDGNATTKSVDLTFAYCVYALIVWILEGKKLGKGYGFPFDRQHLDFTLRLKKSRGYIRRMKRRDINDQTPGYKTLLKLEKRIIETINDEEIITASKEIQKDIKIFDKLREAMRIAPKEGSDGLNDNGGNEDIKSIEKKVSGFRQWLNENEDCTVSGRYKAFISQIDKYWDKLFADPIEVETSSGKKIIQPQRTNNILEQLFRNFKQWYRRKSGCGTMGKTLRAMVDNTPLVRNLKNDEYMKAILGNDHTLEEAFANIDSLMIRKEMKEAKQYPNKIPAPFKKLAKNDSLPKMLLNMLKKVA
ncbi:MAG: transposase [SAR324 cluster bacterium]|nr:transposase [SAR324 cluster bacterium]